MKTKKYSSKIVEYLLTNEVWSFWKKDWSKRIVVQWDPSKVNRKRFFEQVKKHVGSEFIYERSLSGMPAYKATKKGLVEL